jgi:hypothetical protein
MDEGFDNIENLEGEGAPEGKTATFKQFQWQFEVVDVAAQEPEDDDDIEEGLDATTREFAKLLNIRHQRTTIRAFASTHDGRYCYLCEVAHDRKNLYRKTILDLLELRDEVNVFFLYHTIALYYQNELQDYTKAAWPAQAVARHMNECNNEPRYQRSHDLRLLSAYNALYTRTAVRIDEEGNELPPDHVHVKFHLQIIEARRKQAAVVDSKKQKQR